MLSCLASFINVDFHMPLSEQEDTETEDMNFTAAAMTGWMGGR